MSDNRFVYNPSSLDIGRSKFLMNSFWKGSIYHGDLVPVEVTRVMPGDSAKYNISAFIRTATPPIAPFMDTVHLNFAAFYVPERLVWNKEKEFLGENTEGYGIQSEVLAPRSNANSMTVPAAAAANANKRSLGAYLGLVRQTNSVSTSDHSFISLNPIRCVLQCYNDWFRNENFMAPYLWDHSQTGDGTRSIATLNGSNVYAQDNVPKVCKQLDRYTSCLPWAQKGNAVTLSVGGLAPVVVDEDYEMHDMNGAIKFGYRDGSNNPVDTAGDWSDDTVIANRQMLNLSAGLVGSMGVTIDDHAGAGEPITRSNLLADLTNASGTTINQFRLAFATQRYLEALARTGSKYREYIKGMFGVNIGDTTAQMAEYLGGMSIELNIDQVLQTTSYAAGATTKLGAPGASSTSAASDYLFTKSFTEPGYIVIFAYTKHNRSYGQGIDEIYQKHEVLEEYNPKFANIGEIAIKKSNVFFTGLKANDDDRLGFQEAWSEYRHKRNLIVSELCPSNTNSFNFWSLADNFATAPTLNAAFLTEDRTNIARCLAGGENGPDYFLDIKFDRVFVRPMPLYSIPGLIDHH